MVLGTLPGLAKGLRAKAPWAKAQAPLAVTSLANQTALEAGGPLFSSRTLRA